MVLSEQSNLGRRVEKIPETIQGTRYLWQFRPAKQELSREIEIRIGTRDELKNPCHRLFAMLVKLSLKTSH
jgi:hypothetical protein